MRPLRIRESTTISSFWHWFFCVSAKVCDGKGLFARTPIPAAGSDVSRCLLFSEGGQITVYRDKSYGVQGLLRTGRFPFGAYPGNLNDSRNAEPASFDPSTAIPFQRGPFRRPQHGRCRSGKMVVGAAAAQTR